VEFVHAQAKSTAMGQSTCLLCRSPKPTRGYKSATQPGFPDLAFNIGNLCGERIHLTGRAALKKPKIVA
jgi:hypothetical protein